MKFIKIERSIKYGLFFIIVLFLTRQIPLKNYNYIMNIALFAFFVISIKDIYVNISSEPIVKITIFFLFSVVSLFIIYSVLRNNNPNYIIRFFLIIFFLFLAYFIDGNKIYINIFMVLIGLQAFVVISLELYLIILKKNILFGYPIRQFFLQNDWGDVYKLESRIWNIQLRGNALLPFAFFISLIYFKGKRKKIISSIFLLSIIFAGNFAFLLGTIIFLIIYYLYRIGKKSKINYFLYIIIFQFIILILFLPVISYIEKKIIEKSEMSNVIRIEQLNLLIADMSQDFSTILLGKGLGNTINKITKYRDYTKSTYYELQIIYLLNQLGILIFILFLLTNIFISIYTIKKRILLYTYICYILYSLFNPYFLDTNNIIVIIILLSIKEVLYAENIFYCSNISNKRK